MPLIMEDRKLTFNEVPQAVSALLEKVGNLEELIEESLFTRKEESVWMNIDELCSYLPTKPAKQTVYGWVCDKFIPYHKKGKRLQFLKTEIDTWLLDDNSFDDDDAVEEQALRIRQNIIRRR